MLSLTMQRVPRQKANIALKDKTENGLKQCKQRWSAQRLSVLEDSFQLI